MNERSLVVFEYNKSHEAIDDDHIDPSNKLIVA